MLRYSPKMSLNSSSSNSSCFPSYRHQDTAGLAALSLHLQVDLRDPDQKLGHCDIQLIKSVNTLLKRECFVSGSHDPISLLGPNLPYFALYTQARIYRYPFRLREVQNSEFYPSPVFTGAGYSRARGHPAKRLAKQSRGGASFDKLRTNDLLVYLPPLP